MKTSEILAKATIQESNESPEIEIELRHDADGAYRWYQSADGADTEVSADSRDGAIEAAYYAWRNWFIAFAE